MNLSPKLLDVAHKRLFTRRYIMNSQKSVLNVYKTIKIKGYDHGNQPGTS